MAGQNVSERARAARWWLAATLVLALFAASCGSETANTGDAAAQEPEPVATEEAEPEPVATEEAEPEPVATEEAEPEPVATEEVEPEPVATEEPEPELTDEEIAQVPLAAESIDWTDCGQAQCGTLTVPVDYDDPTGETLELVVGITRATSAEDRKGYLYFHPGGPGPSVIQWKDADIWPEELTAAFDMVFLEPRGIGESEPSFDCGDGIEQRALLNEIDEWPDTPEEIELGVRAAQFCSDAMGPVANSLTTLNLVHDLDELRKALGTEQVSFLGMSYGSQVAGLYASVYPDHVDAVVVDGAADPLAETDTIEEFLDTVRDSTGPWHAQLQKALESCDTPECPIYNDGDPVGYYLKVAEDFDIVVDEVGGDWSFLFPAINGSLYSEADWPNLHNALADLGERQDPSGLVNLAVRSGIIAGEINYVTHVLCLDGPVLKPGDEFEEEIARVKEFSVASRELVEAEYPLVAAIDSPIQSSACQFYGELGLEEWDGTFDGGGVPVLVVGNTSDQVTPFVQSETYAKERLSNGHLIIGDAAGHVIYPGNACVNDLVHAALIDGDFPADDVTCERQDGPLEDAEPVSLGPVEMVPFELPGGATALRPDGWDELGPGTFLRADDNPVGTILAFIPTEGDTDAAIAEIAEVAGVEPEAGPVVDIEGNPWQVYQAALPGDEAIVTFGVGPEEWEVIVLLQATPADLDELVDSALLPAAAGFAPAPE